MWLIHYLSPNQVHCLSGQPVAVSSMEYHTHFLFLFLASEVIGGHCSFSFSFELKKKTAACSYYE